MFPALLKTSKLLLFSPNWLGDVVMALPAFQKWCSDNPDAEITVLAKPGVAPLWDFVEGVKTVITLHTGENGMRRTIDELTDLNPDTALLLPHTFRAAWLAWRAGIAHRRGTAGQLRGWMVNDKVGLKGLEKQHQQFEIARLFGLAHDVALPAPRLVPPDALQREMLARLGQENRPLLAILPGAARGESKRWPAENFAASVQAALRRHPEMLCLVCGTNDEAAACRVVSEALGDRAINLAGKTKLSELAALLGLCRVVCCNDSGGMHLAAAVGAPVVAIFGLTDPLKTGPLGNSWVVAPKGVKASRRIARDSLKARRALRSIGTEVVSDALLEALAR
jgi:heptosyltransferase-2